MSDNGKYLGDAVYGALDGIVTTFAVVAGVAGASLSSTLILVLGLANLLADGTSMAAGNYLGRKSESDYRTRTEQRERRLIKNKPQEARKDVREQYRARGFSGKLLDSIVKHVTGDADRWLYERMFDKHGSVTTVNPVKAGITTFVAFVIAGAVPLLSYVLAILLPSVHQYSFGAAIVLTAAALFGVGSLRSLLIDKPWWKAGAEMLFVGGIAAVVAFLVGYGLRGLAA